LPGVPGPGPRPQPLPPPAAPRPRLPGWVRALPWLLSGAACVLACVLWLDCRHHRRHLEDELRKALAARDGKAPGNPPGQIAQHRVGAPPPSGPAAGPPATAPRAADGPSPP